MMAPRIPIVLSFSKITAADLPLVGGKGANLGEMTQAGFPVPAGFCITTNAFQQFIAAYPDAEHMYQELKSLDPGDVTAVRRVGAHIRTELASIPIPDIVREAILSTWQETGREHHYAVRSSATAEDLPGASFAGQQDTFLNIQGEADLLDSVRRCWVSLFTDRAIIYRQRNHFGHRNVYLSVVVQRMVPAEGSGILFTADPVSGHRHTASIDASYGLGEALVAGFINPDSYKVDRRTGRIIDRQIGDKQLAIRPLPGGGTTRETITGDARTRPALTDVQVLELVQIGNRIEQHYGRPQDIEWCLAGGQFFIVQSRPITTLFPLPEPRPDDDAFRIYFSFGHVQVMTDAMLPMGRSVIRILLPFGKSSRPLAENPYLCTAGGRLYVDLTPLLHARLPRHLFPRFLSVAEPLSAQIIRDLVHRREFKERPPQVGGRSWDVVRWFFPFYREMMLNLLWRRPEGMLATINQYIANRVAHVQAQLAAAPPGAARLRRAHQILGDIFAGEVLDIAPYVFSGFLAQLLLLRIARRYGAGLDAEATMRGLSGNVAIEMDLAVGDLADKARQSPALVALLQAGEAEAAFQAAASLPDAQPFWADWQQFIRQYGMRGPSEIDISRPRWSENPDSLLRMITGSLSNAEPGAHRRHQQRMEAAGEAAAARLETRLRRGLLGPVRVKLVRRLLRVGRNLAPMREHPKFFIIQVFGLLRTAILEAGEILHGQSRLCAAAEVWFLNLPELIAVLEDETANPRQMIAQRQAEMAHYQQLTPPRVITSDGEIPVAAHIRANIPAGALAGSAVSTGVVEGIAHVVLDPTQETLQPGEILVAPFTDPGWTPLFINAAGLVMEVGGLMTHGSVVAREYGIPAVVAVPEATTRIQTGQHLRVHGDAGYVEILN
jgi:pyruvate,water dikinase